MSMSDSPPVPLRAAIVAVQLPDVDDRAFAASLAELHRLGRTLGVAVVATITQRRQTLHPAAVLGKGKLAELQALAGRSAAQANDGDNDGEGDEDDAPDERAGDGFEADEGDRQADAAAVVSTALPIEAVLVDHDI